MDVAVFHAQPRLLAALIGTDAFKAWTTGSPKVALTTWETSHIPPHFANALREFDEVIVPSEFCADVICGTLDLGHDRSLMMKTVPDAPTKMQGGSLEATIVPHCFDPAFWVRDWPKVRGSQGYPLHDSPYGSSPAANVTRFYTMGAWGDRKNASGVLKAYLHEFTREDPVHLTMVCDRIDLEEVRGLIARSGLATSELPRLTIPPRTELTEYELRQLHRDADVYVSATRGEGWGLSHFEAAISGNHVITPLYGGQADFLDEYALCDGVPFNLTPCFGEGKTILVDGQLASRVTMPPGMNAKQSWAEPDLHALSVSMRRVHSEILSPPFPDAADRSELERKFGYKTVGQMLVATLQEHIG